MNKKLRWKKSISYQSPKISFFLPKKAIQAKHRTYIKVRNHKTLRELFPREYQFTRHLPSSKRFCRILYNFNSGKYLFVEMLAENGQYSKALEIFDKLAKDYFSFKEIEQKMPACERFTAYFSEEFLSNIPLAVNNMNVLCSLYLEKYHFAEILTELGDYLGAMEVLNKMMIDGSDCICEYKCKYKIDIYEELDMISSKRQFGYLESNFSYETTL